jgi:hypothetical protein
VIKQEWRSCLSLASTKLDLSCDVCVCVGARKEQELSELIRERQVQLMNNYNAIECWQAIATNLVATGVHTRLPSASCLEDPSHPSLPPQTTPLAWALEIIIGMTHFRNGQHKLVGKGKGMVSSGAMLAQSSLFAQFVRTMRESTRWQLVEHAVVAGVLWSVVSNVQRKGLKKTVGAVVRWLLGAVPGASTALDRQLESEVGVVCLNLMTCGLMCGGGGLWLVVCAIAHVPS